jgi:hypothetical protein
MLTIQVTNTNKYLYRTRHHLLNASTSSVCSVCGNRSTGTTRSSENFPSSQRWMKLDRVLGLSALQDTYTTCWTCLAWHRALTARGSARNRQDTTYCSTKSAHHDFKLHYPRKEVMYFLWLPVKTALNY